MSITNLYEAKTHLSQLIERAIKGEEIVIARHGHPVVKLIPCTPPKSPRKPGILKGKITIADDFDTLPESIMKQFYGDEEQ